MVAFLPVPSVALAVILTFFPFPAFFAVTPPFLETVAYWLFEELHCSVLFAVLPVVFTAALILSFFSAFTVLLVVFNRIRFTACFTILIL
mgnify:CR=1 FL=1